MPSSENGISTSRAVSLFGKGRCTLSARLAEAGPDLARCPIPAVDRVRHGFAGKSWSGEVIQIAPSRRACALAHCRGYAVTTPPITGRASGRRRRSPAASAHLVQLPGRRGALGRRRRSAKGWLSDSPSVTRAAPLPRAYGLANHARHCILSPISVA